MKRHTKICKCCGKEFEGYDGGYAYCSPECHEQALISRHTFVCKGCGVSFYSPKFNVAYCTDKCRKRQSRLRHIHRCPSCMKIFFGPAGQKYCSTDCQHKSKRTAERDHVCVNCGKEFSRPKRDRDSCQFCSRDCAFEYKSKITSQIGRHKRHIKRIRRCGVCGRIFFINGHSARYCSDACRQTTYNSQELRRQRFNPQKKICRNCGKEFMTQFKKSKVFCSGHCQDAYAREVKRLRKHRLDGKIIDRDITLMKLSVRDDGICQLCGLPVDWSDYIVDENGTFIAGKNYPSVDHIYPISRGLHAWDNVQLAHFSCNSAKRDAV